MRQTLTTPALVTGVMLVTLVTVADTRIMTVAAIFDEGGASQHELAFKHAVEAVNRNRCLALIICTPRITTTRTNTYMLCTLTCLTEMISHRKLTSQTIILYFAFLQEYLIVIVNCYHQLKKIRSYLRLTKNWPTRELSGPFIT